MTPNTVLSAQTSLQSQTWYSVVYLASSLGWFRETWSLVCLTLYLGSKFFSQGALSRWMEYLIHGSCSSQKPELFLTPPSLSFPSSNSLLSPFEDVDVISSVVLEYAHVPFLIPGLSSICHHFLHEIVLLLPTWCSYNLICLPSLNFPRSSQNVLFR